MKKLILLLAALFLCGAVLTPNAFSLSWTIDDNYIGDIDQTYDKYLFNEGDVVAGSQSRADNNFDIESMNVDISGNTMTVDIKTGYYTNNSNFGTTYGDLFIDDMSTDAEWDYVFDVSSGNLYEISNSADSIIFSDDVGADPSYHVGSYENRIWPSSWYRHYEEVLVNPEGLSSIGSGTAGRDGDYFSMSFDISGMDLSADSGFDLGLHWTQTCGNDVIKGNINATGTPEPSTILLFGVGIVGAAVLRKKRTAA